MKRTVWGAAVGAAVIGLGIAAFEVARPRPVPAVTATMTVAAADTSDPAAARYLADVHRKPGEAGTDRATGHTVVEVRVNWQVAATHPPRGCDVNVVVVPDTFDVAQAMQYADAQRHAQSAPGGTWDAGWETTSGADVARGSDGRVTPAFRDAGVPRQDALSTTADPGHDTLIYVYKPVSALSAPVDPTRFRAWTLLRCGDRTGPVTALTGTAS